MADDADSPWGLSVAGVSSSSGVGGCSACGDGASAAPAVLEAGESSEGAPLVRKAGDSGWLPVLGLPALWLPALGYEVRVLA